MPTISVCIASYNHEKYIAETISSVLDQTYQDFEIIIVDDGSTDRTVEVIKSFRNQRIKFFSFEENQGACVAIKKCIEKAQGKYIAILNSDDVFYKDKLEKQLNFLESNTEIAAVFTKVQLINENGEDFNDKTHFYYEKFNQNNRNRYQWLNYFFYHGNCLCHPSVLIRKDCYDVLGFYDLRFAQLPDFDFWVRLCLSYEIHILQEKLVKFRIRDNEMNASAERFDVRKRSTLEQGLILQHYLKIASIDEFNYIFSNSPYSGEQYEEIIPFYIAHIALRIESSAYQNFAINTLLKIAQDSEMMERLGEICNFQYKDLIRITGESDVFNLTSNYFLGNITYLLAQEQPKITFNKNARIDYLKYLVTVNAKTRPIIIWGTGNAGLCVFSELIESNINVIGFLDSDKAKWNTSFQGKNIYPLTILSKGINTKRPFVIIGSSYVEEIEALLKEYNFLKEIDYISLF